MWSLLFSKDKSLMFSATDQTGNSNSREQWVYFHSLNARGKGGKREKCKNVKEKKKEKKKDLPRVTRRARLLANG